MFGSQGSHGARYVSDCALLQINGDYEHQTNEDAS